MRRRAVLAAVLAGLAACRAEPPADPPLLRLGEHSVLLSDFQRYLADVQSRGETPLDSGVRRALLEAFLEERVVVLEARRRGLVEPGASPEAEAAASSRVVAEAARGLPTPSDAEVSAYYAEHLEDFQQPETVTLRQILVGTLNEARDVLRRLRRDPRSFERLARSMSKGPEAVDGGRMGTFARGQLPPELEQPAFSLAPGATGGPVESPLGYHVLRVDARTPARECSLEDCRAVVLGRLEQERADRAVREFVRALLARAEVNHEAAQRAVGDRP